MVHKVFKNARSGEVNICYITPYKLSGCFHDTKKNRPYHVTAAPPLEEQEMQDNYFINFLKKIIMYVKYYIDF